MNNILTRTVLRRYLFLILAVSALTSARGYAQVDSTPAAVLHPGDVARIAVWRRPDFSGDFAISADGTISHPIFREVEVAGVPLDTARARIARLLTNFDSVPAFTFTPLLRIYIVGEVRLPNSYTLPAGTTIAEVLGFAGGPTADANLDKIQLVRGGHVQVIGLTGAAASSGNVAIRSGDELLVGRRRDLLRDYMGPAAAVVAALVAVANFLKR